MADETIAMDDQQERCVRHLLLDEGSNVARVRRSADPAYRVEGPDSRESGSTTRETNERVGFIT